MIVSRFETAIGLWKAGYKNQLLTGDIKQKSEAYIQLTRCLSPQQTPSEVGGAERALTGLLCKNSSKSAKKKKKVGFYTPLSTTLWQSQSG